MSHFQRKFSMANYRMESGLNEGGQKKRYKCLALLATDSVELEFAYSAIEELFCTHEPYSSISDGHSH